MIHKNCKHYRDRDPQAHKSLDGIFLFECFRGADKMTVFIMSECTKECPFLRDLKVESLLKELKDAIY